MGRLSWVFLIASVVWMVACAPIAKTAQVQTSTSTLSAPTPPVVVAPPSPSPVIQPQPPVVVPGPTPATKLGLCSALDFSGVIWSMALPTLEREMLSLALNITGSFEGHNSWATLAGNSDGQGLSMGLLQQNFGQGTLQPLFSEVQAASPSVMQSVFSAANLKSLLAMLTQWKNASSTASIQLGDYGYSDLDDLAEVARDMGVELADLQNVQTALLARNQAAVDWAVRNIYTNGSFKIDWKSQLTSLAVTSNYRSLQVGRAERLHASALEMLHAFKMHELRSYLFFFDIAVQNGGISSSIRSSFMAWQKSHTTATESAQLSQLLILRLALVNPKYVSDVRSRKNTVITGVGTVHGQARSLEKEYCISLATKI